MKTKQTITGLMLFFFFSAVTPLRAQMPGMTEMTADHIMVMPDSIKWGESPPGLPAGAKAAVLEGDPRVAGPFTMRAKVPANWSVKPHTHPGDEHVTVLEGSAYMGLGEKYDEKTAKAMPQGAFAVMKKGTAHYFYTKKPCVIQIHGMGPWGITYINPADDPRNAK